MYIKLGNFVSVLLPGIGYGKRNCDFLLFFICNTDIEVRIIKSGIRESESKWEKRFDTFFVVSPVTGEDSFCIIYLLFFRVSS